MPESFRPMFELLEHYGYLVLMLLIYWGVLGVIIRPFFMLIQYLLSTPWF